MQRQKQKHANKQTKIPGIYFNANKQTKIPGIYFNSRIKILPRISRGFVWFSDIFKEDK